VYVIILVTVGGAIMETKPISFGTDLNVFTQTGYYAPDTNHTMVNVASTHSQHFSPDGKTQYFFNMKENFLEYTKTLLFNEAGEYQGCEVIKYQYQN
jgi:hypothetical protein